MPAVICEGCDRVVDIDLERPFFHKKSGEVFCEWCLKNVSDEELEEDYYE